jgi:hypothetical protein
MPEDPTESPAAKLAAAIKKPIEDAGDVAKAASQLIGEDKYTRGELISTFTKLTSIAITGGLQVTQTAFEVRPRRSEGMMVLADNMVTIARRTMKFATDVAVETVKAVADEPLSSEPWIRAGTKLTDIAVVSGIEAAQAAAIGPANYANRTFDSDVFTADANLGNGELRVAGDFARTGTQGSAVPRSRITFKPTRLGPDQRTFQVVVNESGLPSGVYEGTVAIDGGQPMTVAIRL